MKNNVLKLSLILFCINFICGINAVQAASDFSRVDYEIPKFSIEATGIEDSQQLVSTIDRSIFQTIENFKSEKVKSNTDAVIKTILAGQLTEQWQFITGLVAGSTGTKDGPGGFVGVIPSGNSILAIAIFIHNRYLQLPLFSRLIVLHEGIGHLPQYISLVERYGKTEGLKRVSEEEFMREFFLMTHLTTPILEAEFFRKVPKEMLFLEVENSSISESDKQSIKNYANLFYNSKSEFEFAQLKVQLEACNTRPPEKSCYSDQEIEEMFNYIKGKN